GTKIAPPIATRFSISHLEVWPSASGTFELAKTAFPKDPIFGAGPNRFRQVWRAEKPDGINATPFWNADFDYGAGYIPTSLITTGLVGFLAWLLFLALLFWKGFKTMRMPDSDPLSKALTLTFSLGALYLFIMAFLYVPGTALLGLTFIWGGAMIGLTRMREN